MIVFRESNVYIKLIPYIVANNLVLKCVNKCVRANSKVIAVALAALKVISVNCSVVADIYNVTLFNSPVLNGYKP